MRLCMFNVSGRFEKGFGRSCEWIMHKCRKSSSADCLWQEREREKEELNPCLNWMHDEIDSTNQFPNLLSSLLYYEKHFNASCIREWKEREIGRKTASFGGAKWINCEKQRANKRSKSTENVQVKNYMHDKKNYAKTFLVCQTISLQVEFSSPSISFCRLSFEWKCNSTSDAIVIGCLACLILKKS